MAESARASADEVKEEIKNRLAVEDVIGGVIALTRLGREMIGLCPFHQEKTGSFTVAPDKGFYHCFGCGAHGDVIAFYMAYHEVAYPEALLGLAHLAGITLAGDAAPPPKQQLKRGGVSQDTPQPPRKGYDRRPEAQAAMRDRILSLWRGCLPANDTSVAAYLRGRGIDLDLIGGVPPSLRFHPDLLHIHPVTGERSHWPAMIGGVQGPDGNIVALHRTFLSQPNANGHVGKAPEEKVPKAKLMLGPCMTGAVRLAPAADRLGVSEGIENGLIVMCEMRRAGRELGVWAAMTLGNIGGGGLSGGMRKKHPLQPGRFIQSEIPDPQRPGVILPKQVRCVVVLGDGDSDPYNTRAIVHRGTRRWQGEGRQVIEAWARPGHDFVSMAARNDNRSPGQDEG